MTVRALAFTQQGKAWQEKLGFPVERGVPVREWAREAFDMADALLFIGACGIAVRAVAPLVTYSAQALRAAPGVFSHSDFVQRTVGVDCVCERAAVLVSGGHLMMGKTVHDGMTFALAGQEEER